MHTIFLLCSKKKVAKREKFAFFYSSLALDNVVAFVDNI